MKRIQKIFLVIAVTCMLLIVYKQLDQIKNYQWEIKWDVLILSIGLLLVPFVTGPMGWRFILKSLTNKKLQKLRIFCIWTISSSLRYIPGTIWTYVSRVTYAKAENIGIGEIMLSIYLEQIILLLAVVALGFPFLFTLSDLPVSPVVVFLLFFILSFLIHPASLRFLFKVLGILTRMEYLFTIPSVKTLLKIYVFYLFHWLSFSLAFLSFAMAITPVAPEFYLPVMFSNLIAYAIGFIVIFFPSGIGIRESTLYFLLQPYFPPTICLVLAIGSRVWVIVGESIALLAAVCLQGIDRRIKE